MELRMSDITFDDVGTKAKSVREFARSWGIGESSAWKEIREGRLTARKIGRRTLITAADEQEYARSLPRAGVAA
jgi:hypothetical protein